MAACATGSTWARMSPAVLTKHVLAFAERLGVSEGSLSSMLAQRAAMRSPSSSSVIATS